MKIVLTIEEIIKLMKSEIKSNITKAYRYCIKNDIKFSDLLELCDISTTNECFIDSVTKFISNNITNSNNDFTLFLNYIKNYFEFSVSKIEKINYNRIFCPNIEFRKIERSIRHCLRDNAAFFDFYVDHLDNILNHLKYRSVDSSIINTPQDYSLYTYIFFLQYSFWGLFEVMYVKKDRGEVFYLYNENAFYYYIEHETLMKNLFLSCHKYGQSYADEKIKNIQSQLTNIRSTSNFILPPSFSELSNEAFVNAAEELILIRKNDSYWNDPNFVSKFKNVIQQWIDICFERCSLRKELLIFLPGSDSSFSDVEKQIILKLDDLLYIFLTRKISKKIEIMPRFISDFIAESVYYESQNKFHININAYKKKISKFINDLFSNSPYANLEYISLKIYVLYTWMYHFKEIRTDLNIHLHEMSYQYFLQSKYEICDENGNFNYESFSNLLNEGEFLCSNRNADSLKVIREIVHFYGRQAFKIYWNSFKNLPKQENNEYIFSEFIIPFVTKSGLKGIQMKKHLERTEIGEIWEYICNLIAYDIYGIDNLSIHPHLKSGGIPDMALFFNNVNNRILIECKLTEYFTLGGLVASEQFQEYISDCNKLEFWIYKKSEIPLLKEDCNVEIKFYDELIQNPKISKYTLEKAHEFERIEKTNQIGDIIEYSSDPILFSIIDNFINNSE